MSCECSAPLNGGDHASWCPARGATRELVRCGCGTVRNDEDAPAPLAFLHVLAYESNGFKIRDPRVIERSDEFEQPRACRGCGAVYLLPKPQPPKEKR